MTYDEAVSQLFQAPIAEFVAERKRLAAQIKTGGDKDSAAKLLKVGRPSVSAWAVNQLWWKERALFDELFATALLVRGGDLAAMPAHKAVVAKLHAAALAILTAAGNAAADATMHRVDITISALAAAGGFEPEPPGTLVADREAPGFASLGIAPGPALSIVPAPAGDAADAHAEKAHAEKAHAAKAHAEKAHAEKAHAEKEEAKKAAGREKEEAGEKEAARKEEAREKDAARKEAAREAEARRLQAEAVRAARDDVKRLTAAAARLESELADAQTALAAAKRHLSELEQGG